MHADGGTGLRADQVDTLSSDCESVLLVIDSQTRTLNVGHHRSEDASVVMVRLEPAT